MTVHCQFIIWSNDRQGLGPSLTPLRHLPLWAMGNPEMMHGQWRRNNTTKCNTPRLKKQTRAANVLSYSTSQCLKITQKITFYNIASWAPFWTNLKTLFSDFDDPPKRTEDLGGIVSKIASKNHFVQKLHCFLFRLDSGSRISPRFNMMIHCIEAKKEYATHLVICISIHLARNPRMINPSLSQYKIFMPWVKTCNQLYIILIVGVKTWNL